MPAVERQELAALDVVALEFVPVAGWPESRHQDARGREQLLPPFLDLQRFGCEA